MQADKAVAMQTSDADDRDVIHALKKELEMYKELHARAQAQALEERKQKIDNSLKIEELKLEVQTAHDSLSLYKNKCLSLLKEQIVWGCEREKLEKALNETNAELQKTKDKCNKEVKILQRKHEEQHREIIHLADKLRESQNEIKKIEEVVLELNSNNLMLQREQQMKEEERECVVCGEHQRDVIFWPCRHICACKECTQSLRQPDTCPICRKVSVAHEVFYS